MCSHLRTRIQMYSTTRMSCPAHLTVPFACFVFIGPFLRRALRLSFHPSAPSDVSGAPGAINALFCRRFKFLTKLFFASFLLHIFILISCSFSLRKPFFLRIYHCFNLSSATVFNLPFLRSFLCCHNRHLISANTASASSVLVRFCSFYF